MTRRRFPLWTLFGVVVVIALLIGSGAFSSHPPTAAQRAASVESVLRCPTCEDLSVAQSSAPTAVAVRAVVVQQVAAGRTDQQIEAYLVDRYGASIELDPPASGWSLLVWLLPVLGGLVATTVVVTVLVRRRGSVDRGPDEVDGSGGLDPGVADERRRFLTKSLADADAEYLAGDLSDKDYLALRQRDLARLAVLDAPVPALAAAPSAGRAPLRPTAGGVSVDDRVDMGADGPPGPGDADPGTPPSEPTARRFRLRGSSWFLVVGCTCIAAALVVAVFAFAGNRQPGQSATGSFAQSAQQQIEEDLATAASDENSGEIGQAADLYQTVLAKHPDNEVAMAQLGWLEVETGQQGKSASLIADGRAKLTDAVQLNPDDYAARLYLGTLLLTQDGNVAGAVDQYRHFLADRPPASLVTQAAPEIRNAYTRAGLPVPALVAG